MNTNTNSSVLASLKIRGRSPRIIRLDIKILCLLLFYTKLSDVNKFYQV